MSDKKTQTESSKETTADKIWSEIKNLTLELFALPNQTVAMHVKRVPITDDTLHLTLSSQAVLAALDARLGGKYVVESAEKYVTVKYAST